MNVRVFVSILFCFSALTFFSSNIVGQSYTVTALGNLPNHFAASPNDISNSGIIVGHTRLNSSNERHAFVYDVQNGMSLLEGTGDAYAHGISDDGQHIIGRYNGNNIIPASRWDWDGTDYRLNVLGTAQRTTTGLAVNNSAQGVGNSFFSQLRGFAHDGSSFFSSSLGDSANDINNLGVIAGIDSGLAFVADMTTLTPQSIGQLGGGSSDGRGINDLNEIVGSSTTAAGETHAFYYDGTSMMDLGTLGGEFSAANEINIHSQVVGESTISDLNPITRAFIWQNGTMTDLNSLIDPSSGWLLETASSINDQGQIIGIGTLNGTTNQAYLLTVVPEPDQAVMLLLSLFLLIFVRRHPVLDWRNVRSEHGRV